MQWNTAAVEAVRNRKQFFKKLIHSKLREHKTMRLLNIASGPARDLKEIYDEINPERLQTTCVEMDANAIEYAKNLCGNYLLQIEFINQNIFKFSSNEKFDLIWSAGLFDYFNDKIFIQLTKRLRGYLNQNGEMVIGNFSRNNPHRTYMEIFGEWFLNHRNVDELLGLAIQAGVDKSKITVNEEPLGVNLFLRMNNQTA
ncbi:MAG: methyltransferase domain-containing protein [Bacteroidetes bacterium]|nr:MAG: methyltransferase domain-containing protein [Bacteroidota bacterium]